MKKILFLGLSLFTFVTLSMATTVTMTGTGDTLTDAGTDFVVQQVQGTYKHISVQAVFTKISGTVAGTGILYGSVDGTNYVQLNTDTLTMTNQTTNTKIWVLTNANYMYYKIVYLGSGTMSGVVKGYLFTSNPQGKHAVTNMLQATGAATDTVTNSATGYVGLQIKSSYNTVTIQAVVTKISGTAGGTVTLQGSNDGVNYVTVSTDYSTAQTLSVTNVTTNTKIFIVTGSPYSYYRLSHTGTGTMSTTIRGYVMPNT
jgi:hypothetical protein